MVVLSGRLEEILGALRPLPIYTGSDNEVLWSRHLIAMQSHLWLLSGRTTKSSP